MLTVGSQGTVKLTPLLATPPTLTTTLPVAKTRIWGTSTTMLAALQLVGVATDPMKVTVLVPCVAPKFTPVIVTEVPARPDVGFMLVMVGAVATVKLTPLLATPPTVTTTLPVVAPVGTGTTMLVLLQLVGVSVVPLSVTVLDPWVAPKFTPVMVTDVPTEPDVGFRLVMYGATTPVPVSAIVVGTVFALFATLSAPLRAPPPLGENATLAVQLLPTAKGDVEQLSVSEKSPVVLAMIVIACVPELVSATGWGELAVPAVCVAKLSDVGEAVRRGDNTVTGILRGKLLAPCPYVAVITALPGAIAETVPKESTVAMLVLEDAYDINVD